MLWSNELVVTVEKLGREEFEQTDDVVQELQVPECLQNMRILVYGGTHTFATQLNELLPSISVYKCGNVPPTTTLRLSDAVFLQVQYISHSDYYLIRDLCKINQVPVFHIPTSGTQRTAEFICKKAEELCIVEQKKSMRG